MELIEKSTITDENIINLPKFNFDSTYVKGFFRKVKDILTNEDFLEVYRYVQYWKLEIPIELIQYSLIENYNKLSLLANMLLTGDDDYYKQMSKNIANPREIDFDENDQINEDTEVEYLLDNPEYMKLANERGASLFCDFCKSKSYANSMLKLVKICNANGNYASDDTIQYYANAGIGGVAIAMISPMSDISYIFDTSFVPKDVDMYEFILSNLYDDEFDNEKNEYFLYKILENDKNIDVALFMKLYSNLSEHISTRSKEIIMSHVFGTNNLMLISEFIKFVVDDGFDLEHMKKIVMIDTPNKIAYILFNLEILNSTKYEYIYDYSLQIEEREKLLEDSYMFEY